MSPIPFLPVGAFAAGLVATLVLAAHLTPATWWRRPNARALAVLGGGTIALGSAMLWLFEPAAPARATPLQASARQLAVEPRQGGVYFVWDDLNLRESRSVDARRVAVVPSGAQVTATGRSVGDWWELNARIQGKPVRGWASSLWLRRLDEARR
jgi:Bacterial SH3 domain